jgi:hypothetical protein
MKKQQKRKNIQPSNNTQKAQMCHEESNGNLLKRIKEQSIDLNSLPHEANQTKRLGGGKSTLLYLCN